jgi:hypothetical protein
VRALPTASPLLCFVVMKFILAMLGCAACAATVPPPDARLAQSLDVAHDARAAGALQDVQARAALDRADDEIDRALALVRGGNNRQAGELLIRAKVDGELAIQLAREATMQKRARDTRATVLASEERR